MFNVHAQMGRKSSFLQGEAGQKSKPIEYPLWPKFKNWMEKVTNAAEELRPNLVKFLDDYS